MPYIFKIRPTSSINYSELTLGIPGTGYASIDNILTANTGNLHITGTLANVNSQTADADLTSLAAATGSNLLYYRSSANTWSPVNLAPGIKFAGGVLSDTRVIDLSVVPTGIPMTIGDGRAFYHVPSSMSGYTISSVHGLVGTTGGALTIQLARIRGGVPQDLLSTKLTIDTNTTGSYASTVPAVIATGDLLTNDLLRVDIDGTGSSTVTPLGLQVRIEARY